jgi:FixJ family two-component response regulator
MLTGNADLEGAIKVVNEGNIFRFLTKPCSLEILGKAVEDALVQ